MNKHFETRYEWLRPTQLIERRDACPLVIVPVGLMEYHGPHLPVGVDAINATGIAHAVCQELRKGVVLPTLMMGTERERSEEKLESLGFPPNAYIVGMDLPGRLWNSHYLSEEVFAIHLAAELRLLIGNGYRYIFIANGHGGVNHIEAIRRICVELSATTPTKLAWRLTLSQQSSQTRGGHADLVETSLLMHYDVASVDLDTLPPRDVPIRTNEYSIVDSIGFTPQYRPDHVVQDDPRDATAERGRKLFELCVSECVADVEKLIGVFR
jgi:creatinine amidohydrolase